MIYIIVAMLLYTIAILFGAAASRHTNTNLAAAITNLLSIFIPAAVVLPHLAKKDFTDHRFGILMAALGGLTIGLFVMAINKSYSLNKVGIVTPIIFGGGILLSTIASYFIFNEKVTAWEAVGLGLVLIGLGVILYARAITA